MVLNHIACYFPEINFKTIRLNVFSLHILLFPGGHGHAIKQSVLIDIKKRSLLILVKTILLLFIAFIHNFSSGCICVI